MKTHRVTQRALAGLLGAGLLAALSACETPNAIVRKQGMNAVEQGDLVTAEKRLNKALDQDPAQWKTHYYMGLLRLKQDRPIDAQLSLEKSLTLRPDMLETPPILDALAEAWFRQGSNARLQAMLAQATHDYGKPHDFLRQGRYLHKIGDIDGSKLAFRKAAFFAPADDATPYIEMANFYDDVGDADDALIALRQAYYLTPRDPRLSERIRRHGMIPGPTVGLPPVKTLEDEPHTP